MHAPFYARPKTAAHGGVSQESVTVGIPFLSLRDLVRASWRTHHFLNYPGGTIHTKNPPDSKLPRPHGIETPAERALSHTFLPLPSQLARN